MYARGPLRCLAIGYLSRVYCKSRFFTNCDPRPPWFLDLGCRISGMASNSNDVTDDQSGET